MFSSLSPTPARKKSRKLSLLTATIFGGSIFFLSGCESMRSLKYENQSLQQRIFQHKQDYSALEAELSRLNTERNQLLIDKDKLDSEISVLRQQLDSVITKMGDSQQKQASQLITDVQTRMERENNLKLDVERISAQLESSQNDRALAESRVRELEGTISGLQTDIANYQSSLKVLGENSELLLTERDAARSERDDFRRQLKALESDNSDVAKQVATLSEQLRDKEKESGAMKQKLDQSETELTTMKTQKEAVEQSRSQISEALNSGLSSMITDGRVRVALAPDPTVIILTDDLYQPGTVLLSTDGREVIDSIGNVIAGLTANYSAILIEGHTDSVPVKNMPFIDNWDLAAARAATVTRTLSGRSDIPSKKLRASSHAFFSPLGSNETTDGRQKNRRVEITLVVE